MGPITLYIVKVNTPFLLFLAEMDRLGAFFNNTINQVVQIGPGTGRSYPVIRRYGHAFLLWRTSAYSVLTESLSQNPCFLTEIELRRLHRRFGHPSVRRLHQILERSGHEVEMQALQHLTRYCEHCQKYGKSPGRFNFNIEEDDINFNFNVIVDILYIQGKPVLYLVDEATRFQAGRWLKYISARHVWDQLRTCWIDTYLGPPDIISSDAGKQFTSREFKQYAANMGIVIKNIPVEAHHSIGMVERYHGPLHRVYNIITSEIPGIDPALALQMAFKAINDSVGPNGLVPTLLVFGAYPRMVESDTTPTITQRAVAMRKAMDEVRKSIASRQINDALNTRNGPSTDSIHGLSLNSPVLVFREGNAGQTGSWKGPFRLISMQDESIIVELPSGPTKFRSTSVKPYYHLNPENEFPNAAENEIPNNAESDPTNHEPQNPESDPISEPVSAPVKRGRGRPRKHPAQANLCFVMKEDENQFPMKKGNQFTASRQKEISGPLEKGVFKIVQFEDIPAGARVFNSRFVDEIKNAGTEKAFEKSRLVVQAYNDINKSLVLTQSPTIQRVSQRLLICLATTISNTKLYFRDVTQAYVQSTSDLNLDFYIRPPHELATLLGAPSDCILQGRKTTIRGPGGR